MKLRRLAAMMLAGIMTFTSLPMNSLPVYAETLTEEETEITSEESTESVEKSSTEDESLTEHETESETESESVEESSEVDTEESTEPKVITGEISMSETVSSEAMMASGSINGNLNYSYDEIENDEGYYKLTLSGTGVIEQNSFEGIAEIDKTKVKEVVIGEGITRLGNHSFADFTAIKKITIPSTVTSLGSGVLYQDYGKSSGIDLIINSDQISVDVNDGSPASPFSGATIHSLTFGDSVTTVADNLFSETCFGIKESADSIERYGVTIPAQITSIGKNAFAYSKYLSISFAEGSNLTSIGEFAFIQIGNASGDGLIFDWTNLSDFESIEKCAFSSTNILSKVTLPKNLKTISTSAFNEAEIEDIEILCDATSTSFYQYGAFQRAHISGDITFGADVTTVAPHLFELAELQDATVTIPASVTIIGANAFSAGSNQNTANYGLTNLAFEEGSQLKEIGTAAFAYANITSIELPDSVETIGGRAFTGCPLTSFTIPAGVTTIVSDTFSNCTELKNVYGGENVTSIQLRAFPEANSGLKFSASPGSYILQWAKNNGYSTNSVTTVTFDANHGYWEQQDENYNITYSEKYVTTNVDNSGIISDPPEDYPRRYMDHYVEEDHEWYNDDFSKEFAGWYTTAACTGSPVDLTTYKVTKNTTLYAGYKDRECTVTFHANGGKFANSNDQTITVKKKYKTKLTKSEIPVVTGTSEIGKFNGWYSVYNEETGEYYNYTEFDNGIDVWGDQDYYAGFGDIASGTVGEVVWSIDADGKLTVSGSGEFKEESNPIAPWNQYSESIKTAKVTLTGTQDLSHMFENCVNLTSVDLSGLNTSSATDMSRMFSWCKNLTNVDVSGFNTSKVENVAYMFKGCQSLTSLNLAGFDMRSVKPDSEKFVDDGYEGYTYTVWSGFRYMFDGCSALNQITLGNNFKNSNGVSADHMFADCTSLSAIDLSTLGTSNLTCVTSMFDQCSSLTSLDVSSLTNVSGNADHMFNMCSSLTSITTTGFDTSKITSMGCMFNGCYNLESLDLSGFNTGNVTNMYGMFEGCGELDSLDLSSFNTSKVTNITNMFAYCGDLTEIDMSSFDLSNVSNFRNVFSECRNLRTVKAPKNLGVSVTLPGTGWAVVGTGAAVTELPKGLSESVDVVKGLITDFTTDKTSVVLKPGQTATVTATTTPRTADANAIKWSTANENIASVQKGKVTVSGNVPITITAGNKLGTTKITGKVDNVTKDIDVTVESVGAKKNITVNFNAGNNGYLVYGYYTYGYSKYQTMSFEYRWVDDEQRFRIYAPDSNGNLMPTEYYYDDDLGIYYTGEENNDEITYTEITKKPLPLSEFNKTGKGYVGAGSPTAHTLFDDWYVGTTKWDNYTIKGSTTTPTTVNVNAKYNTNNYDITYDFNGGVYVVGEGLGLSVQDIQYYNGKFYVLDNNTGSFVQVETSDDNNSRSLIANDENGRGKLYYRIPKNETKPFLDQWLVGYGQGASDSDFVGGGLSWRIVYPDNSKILDNWYDHKGDGGPLSGLYNTPGSFTKYTSDVTFYANWVDAATVTFDVGEGSFAGASSYAIVPSGTSIAYDYSKPVYRLEKGKSLKNYFTDFQEPVPTISGNKAFAGWFKDPAFTQPITFNEILKTPVTENVTYYAQYGDAVTVTFDANGGTLSESNSSGGYVATLTRVGENYKVNKIEGQTIGGDYPYISAAPNGKVFAGWYTDKAGADSCTETKKIKDISKYVVNGETTIYAGWRSTEYYTVTFHSRIDGAEFVNGETVTNEGVEEKVVKVKVPKGQPYEYYLNDAVIGGATDLMGTPRLQVANSDATKTDILTDWYTEDGGRFIISDYNRIFSYVDVNGHETSYSSNGFVPAKDLDLYSGNGELHDVVLHANNVNGYFSQASQQPRLRGKFSEDYKDLTYKVVDNTSWGAVGFNMHMEYTGGGYYATWGFYDARCTKQICRTDRITSNADMYCKWAPSNGSTAAFKVTFDAGEGFFFGSQNNKTYNLTAATNTVFLSVETPTTEDGKAFVGWYTDAALTKPYNAAYVTFEDGTWKIKGFAKNQTLYAKYGEAQTIVLHANGASFKPNANYTEADHSISTYEIISIPGNPVRLKPYNNLLVSDEGLTLAGWYLDPECETPANISYIAYSSGTVNTKYDMLFTPVKPGETGYASRVDLYAKWIPYNTAELELSNSYLHGLALSVGSQNKLTLTNPEAYNGVEWCIENVEYAGTNKSTTKYASPVAIAPDGTITGMAEGSCTVYAYLQGKTTEKVNVTVDNTTSFTITYNYMGGKAPVDEEGKDKNPTTYNVGETVTLSAPTRDGYTFAGWFTDSNYSGSPITTIDSSYRNVTLYAGWQGNEETVTFDAGDGTIDPADDATRIVKYGDSYKFAKNYQEEFPVKNLPIPTKVGYDFAGWYTSDGKKIEDDSIVSIVGDHTLNARYSVQDRTVIFDYDKTRSDIEPVTISVTYGSKITKPADPKAAGYKFDGWFKDSACSEGQEWKFDEDTVLGATTEIPTTVYAKWIPTYKLTLNFNGGSIYEIDNVIIETTDSSTKIAELLSVEYPDIDFTTAPAKTKYTFGGWYKDRICSDDKRVDLSNDAVGTGLTIYAKWNPVGQVDAITATLAAISQKNAEGNLYENAVIKLATKTADARIFYRTKDSGDYKQYKDGIKVSDIPTEDRTDIVANKSYKITIYAYAVKEGCSDSEMLTYTATVLDPKADWGDVIDKDRTGYADATKIPDRMWIAGINGNGYEYIAAARTFTFAKSIADANESDIRVYDGKRLLEFGKDYTVAYKNNVNAYELVVGEEGYAANKAPTITVTGKGNYAGALTATFKIKHLNIDTATVANPKVYLKYNGKVQKPGNTITYELENGKTITLKSGTDYKLTYPNTDSKLAGYNADAFKAVNAVNQPYGVLVEGIGNFEGNKKFADDKDYAYEVYIKEAAGNVLMSALSYTIGTADYHDGEAVLPKSIVVKNGTKPLNNGIAFADAQVANEITAKSFLATEEGKAYDYVYYIKEDTNREVGTATITFVGNDTRDEGINYVGSVTKTFNVIGIAINANNIRLKAAADNKLYAVNKFPYSNPVYTGLKQEQADLGELWYNGEKRLYENTDYTVAYSADPVNVGKYTITYTGIGGYTGAISGSFNIKPYDLAEDAKKETDLKKITVALADENGAAAIVYKKGGAKPKATVRFGATELTEGVDFTVAYKNNTKVYQYTEGVEGYNAKIAPTITVTGKGNFAGASAWTYMIAPSSDTAALTLTAADRVYTNKKGNFTTSVVVTDSDGKNLAANVDYYAANDKVYPFKYYYTEETALADGITIRAAGEEVDASDCVPAGTVLKVVVTLKGNYAGNTLDNTFRLVGQDVSKASVKVNTQYYTGKEICPDKSQIVVTLAGRVLAAQDYEIVSYANNINKGTAKLTIKGVGDYGGTKTVTFAIAGKSMYFVISFNGNGATSGSMKDLTLTVGKSTYLTKNAYKRTGFTFGGWSTAPNMTEQAAVEYVDKAAYRAGIDGDPQPITEENIGKTEILYAVWFPDEYKITYYTNGGPNSDKNPTDPDFTFTALSEDITIYAPEREDWPVGYQFGGWYKDAAYKTRISAIKTGTIGNVDLYAKWIPYTYDITFDINAPESEITAKKAKGTMTTETFSYGVPKKLLANKYSWAGHVFMGWSLDKNATEATYINAENVVDIVEPQNNYRGNEILYAVWRNAFTVDFEPEEGYIDHEEAKTAVVDATYDDVEQIEDIYTYTYGTAHSLPTPVREGYSFAGWFKDPNFKTKIASIAKNTYGDMILYAKWTPYTYKIAFNGNGDKKAPAGGRMNAQSAKYDTPVTLTTNTFTRKGYRFSNWNTAPDGSGDTFDNVSEVNFLPAKNGATVTLYAMWDAVDAYGVTFDLHEHGENIDVVYRRPGEALNLNQFIPAEEGYTFNGWFNSYNPTRNTYGTKITQVAASVNDEMTVHAKWTPYSYTIKYDANAASTKENPVAGKMSNQSAKYDTPVNLTANAFTRKGYRFDGWMTTEEGTVVEYNNAEQVNILPVKNNDSVTLYAKWVEAENYTVTFEANGGVLANNIITRNIANDVALSLLDDESPARSKPYAPAYIPERYGYDFAGWFKESTFKTKVTSVAYATYNSDVTLYAKWTPKTYKVAFNANAPEGRTATGKMNPINNVKYGVETAITKNAFAVKGYTFRGWSLTPNGGVTYENQKKVANIGFDDGDDIENGATLYAVWERDEYGIIYNNVVEDNSGNVTSYNIDDVTAGSAVADANGNIILKAPYALGDTFLGWYSDAKLTKKVTSIHANSTGVKTFYAKWAKTQYTINYNLNANGDDSVAMDTTKVGYITSYDGEAENGYLLPTATRTGYAFGGWYKEAACKTAVGPIVSSPYVDMTVYAKWIPNAYTLHYDANAPLGRQATGNTKDQVGLKYNSLYLLNANGYKVPGYTFVGWSLSADDYATNGVCDYPLATLKTTKISNLSTDNNDQVNLYAQWSLDNYTVQYVLNGAAANDPDNPTEYTVESADLPLNGVSKTGYIFGGWYKNKNFSEASRMDVIPHSTTGNLVLYAKWIPITYNISFIASPPEGYASTGTMADQQMKYDTSYRLSANKFKVDTFVFLGWDTEADGVGDFYIDSASVKNLTTVDNTNITLYGNWWRSGLYWTSIPSSKTDERPYVVAKNTKFHISGDWLLDCQVYKDNQLIETQTNTQDVWVCDVDCEYSSASQIPSKETKTPSGPDPSLFYFSLSKPGVYKIIFNECDASTNRTNHGGNVMQPRSYTLTKTPDKSTSRGNSCIVIVR